MTAKADEILADDDNLPEPEEMALLNALAELGGTEDVKVSVYRTGKEYHGKQVFIASMPPEEFSLEYLRDKCGGGDFRVHVRKDGGLIANRAVAVEKKEEKSNADLVADLIAANNQQTAPNFNSDGLDRLADAMTNGFSQMSNMIVQMQSNQQQLPPPVDPAAQMQQMLTMMVSMKEFLGGGQKTDPMEGILKGIELAKEIVPSDGEANTFDVLKESIKTFGKPIVEMASKMNGVALPAGAPINYLPAGTAAQLQAPSTPKQPPKNEAEMLQLMIRHQVTMLLKQAKRGADPGLYADLILDQVKPEHIQLILGAENWFQQIAAIVPEVQQHQAWFTELHDFVIDALTPEQEPTIPNTTDQKIPPIMMQAAGATNEPDEYNETGGGYDNDS